MRRFKSNVNSKWQHSMSTMVFDSIKDLRASDLLSRDFNAHTNGFPMGSPPLDCPNRTHSMRSSAQFQRPSPAPYVCSSPTASSHIFSTCSPVRSRTPACPSSVGFATIARSTYPAHAAHVLPTHSPHAQLPARLIMHINPIASTLELSRIGTRRRCLSWYCQNSSGFDSSVPGGLGKVDDASVRLELA